MTVVSEQSRSDPVREVDHVYVVVDLGGTQTRTAVFDPVGEMLTRQAIGTPRTGGPEDVIAAVLSEIHRATARCKRSRTGRSADGHHSAGATPASSDASAYPPPTTAQPGSSRSAPALRLRPAPARSSPPEHPPVWPPSLPGT